MSDKYLVLIKICLVQFCLGFVSAWPILGTQEIVESTNMIFATAILLIAFAIVVKVTVTYRVLWMAWGAHAASAIGATLAFFLENDLAMIPFCVLYGLSIGILYKWCVELVFVLFAKQKTITLGILGMFFGIGGISLLAILSQSLSFVLSFTGVNVLQSVVFGIVIHQEGKRELLPNLTYTRTDPMIEIIQKMVVCMAFTGLSCLISGLIIYDQNYTVSDDCLFLFAIMICVAGISGRIIWPLIAMRGSRTFVFVTMFYLQVIALGMIFAWTDRLLFTVAALITGLIYGGTMSLIPTLITIHFEPEYWNDLLQRILKTWAIAAAIGLFLTIFSYVMFGTYYYILYVNFILLIIGLISSLQFNWY